MSIIDAILSMMDHAVGRFILVTVVCCAALAVGIILDGGIDGLIEFIDIFLEMSIGFLRFWAGR